MEMRCYGKILLISYKDHVSNEEVCAKTQQAFGPHEDLMTIVSSSSSSKEVVVLVLSKRNEKCVTNEQH